MNELSFWTSFIVKDAGIEIQRVAQLNIDVHDMTFLNSIQYKNSTMISQKQSHFSVISEIEKVHESYFFNIFIRHIVL